MPILFTTDNLDMQKQKYEKNAIKPMQIPNWLRSGCKKHTAKIKNTK